MASVSAVIDSTIFINRWSRTRGIVTSDVAVVASSSNWWARKSCRLAIAPAGDSLQCQAALFGRRDHPGVLEQVIRDLRGDLLSETAHAAARAP